MMSIEAHIVSHRSEVSDGMEPRERVIRALFSELNAAGVRYAVLRNYEELPRQTGKDLDLVIAPSDVGRIAAIFRGALRQHGFLCTEQAENRKGITITGVRLNSNPGMKDLVEECVGLDARTYISLDSDGPFGAVRGFSFRIFADELERRLVSQDGCEFYVLSCRDEFLALYKQWKFKGSPKAKQYGDRLLSLLNDSELNRWVRDATGSIAPDCSDLLNQDDHSGYRRTVGRLVQARWGRPSWFRMIRGGLRAFGVWLASGFRGTGPLIYFSGPDGAGKTTLVDQLTGFLGGLSVKHKYFYSLKIVLRGVTRRLAWCKRIGKRTPPPSAHPGGYEPLLKSDDPRDRDTGSRLWRFRKLVALLVGIVDIFIGFCIVNLYRLLGYAVIVETSPYDVFIKYHMPEFKWVERLLGPLLPKPSIGFVLRADPEQIVRRKAELTIEEISDYYRRCDRVLQRCKATHCYVAVATDTGPEFTARQVIQLALAVINRDCPTPIAANRSDE